MKIVYLEDYIEIVETVEKFRLLEHEYLEAIYKIDASLNELFIDNKMIGFGNDLNKYLLSKLLNEKLLDWMGYYLYEIPNFKNKESANVIYDGIEYKISDLASFKDFCQHGLCLPKKPILCNNENI